MEACEVCGSLGLQSDIKQLAYLKYRLVLCVDCYHQARGEGVESLRTMAENTRTRLREQFEVLARQQPVLSPEVVAEMRAASEKQQAAVEESIANYRTERVAALLRDLLDIPSEELYRVSESLVAVANEVPEDPKDEQPDGNPCGEITFSRLDAAWCATFPTVTSSPDLRVIKNRRIRGASIGRGIFDELTRIDAEPVKAGHFTWTPTE